IAAPSRTPHLPPCAPTPQNDTRSASPTWRRACDLRLHASASTPTQSCTICSACPRTRSDACTTRASSSDSPRQRAFPTRGCGSGGFRLTSLHSMADERHLAEARQEARRIIHDLARTIDRKLEVEVRDLPGQERMQVALT